MKNLARLPASAIAELAKEGTLSKAFEKRDIAEEDALETLEQFLKMKQDKR